MCDEIISYVKRFIRGFDLDDIHIGLDVIREVGPGGEFLSTDQTMKMYKTEHWRPDQCNRENLENWIMMGRKDWAEKSTEKAREILKTHTPAPLSETTSATLVEIRTEAETKLKNHHFES
jgi:trimethylamine--corrinoid protein Co-methyltransferase